eukprot:514741_1
MSQRRFHSDWNCSHCNFRNFGSRANCKNCRHGKRPSNNNSNNTNNKRNGDWNCSKCNFLNFKSRTHCKNCNSSKSNLSRSSSSSNNSNNSNRRYNDWNCSNCNFLNFKSRNTCKNCGNHKSNKSKNIKRNSETETLSSGDWKCNKCSFINYSNRMECQKCKTSKINTNEKWFKTQFLATSINDQKTETSSFVSRKGDWNCTKCNYINFGSRSKCNKCNTTKPKKRSEKMEIDANNAENDDNKNTSENCDKIQFAKNSFGHIGSGGIVSKIDCISSNEGYALYVSWHVGVSTGEGFAVFNGDGSALLAVEILKNITFGNKKLNIKDPVKFGDKDGVYKIELRNIPLNFDDEILTRSLAKLNLENFTESHIYFKRGNYSQITDNSLVATSLKSLFMPYNIIDIKIHPANHGVCKSIIKLGRMSDCLNAINILNNKKIDFGVRDGKLKVQLDLRIIIELEQCIYCILQPEIEKMMYLIRKDPSRFFGVKVFLFGTGKSATNKARIVICGNDSKAICLARDLYDDLTKPLILKFDNKYKCKLVYNYLKTEKYFRDFKCCLVLVLMDTSTIKIYGRSEIRNAFKNALDELNKHIVCREIKVTPLFIRYLRQKSQQDKLKKFEQSVVYVNMDIKQKLIEIIYCRQLPILGNTITDNDDDDVQMDNDVDDIKENERVTIAKECITYIEILMKENAVNENDGMKDKTAKDTVACGICFMEIEENEISYKLKKCGDVFHMDCISMQLNSANEPSGSRPVKCAKCNGNICLLDFKDILGSIQKYKQLLLFSIYDCININPNKYRYCPTADCKQIYFVKDNNNSNNKEGKEDDNDNYMDDNIFNCTECMRQYCLNCNVDYHFGLTCETYKLSKDSDKSLGVFLNKYKSDSSTKQCPNCNTITDKLKNTCNHATCVYCHAHFCWKCLWMDSNDNKNGNLVYTHMKT